MGTTPTYALPYPELTDVANVPADTRELAEAVEGALFGGSVGFGAWLLTATQSIPNNTPTRVLFETVQVAPVGVTFASSTATVTKAGLYLIFTMVSYDVSNTTGQRFGTIMVNGTTSARAYTPGSAGGASTCTVARLTRLAAGDGVTVNAQHTAGVAVALTGGYSQLGLIRLGA